MNFDEIGLECNEWIPFESLKIPHTVEQFREWVSSQLPLLKAGMSWNGWMHWLSEEHQWKEIASRLYDPRVLEHFQRYHLDPKCLPLPGHHVNDDKKKATNHIDLKGEPWSLENEKNAWGMLSFPNLPLHEQDLSSTSVFRLTATQLQGYVTQELCPRWARFQQLDYQIESHPRFSGINQKIQSRRQQGIAFKKEVIEALQNPTFRKLLSRSAIFL